MYEFSVMIEGAKVLMKVVSNIVVEKFRRSQLLQIQL